MAVFRHCFALVLIKKQCLCSIFFFSLQYVQDFINQTWSERYQTQISDDGLTLLWSTIVSIFTLGGLIGALIGGTLSVRVGRYGHVFVLFFFNEKLSSLL